MNYKLFLSIAAFFLSSLVMAQAPTPARQLALRQAKRMKDSVGINEAKSQQVYRVNLEIFYRKQRARSVYASQPAVLRAKLRQFENQRDSLYHYILRPEATYQLYLSKKENILRAN